MYSCKKAILKYFAEFTAYINGRDVYVMFSNGGHRLVDSVDDFSEDVKYIILKDSYFIYRKALAEGKTIQVFVDYTTKYNDRTWIDADTIHAYIPVKNYRIKPNEPTFKVGDWVVYDNQPEYEIGQWNLKFEQSYILSDSKECYELWKPQPNEWCWFWDNNDSHRLLARYENALDSDGKHYYGYCEPFIGTLPTGCTK